jgi:signal transduction histidine kinase
LVSLLVTTYRFLAARSRSARPVDLAVAAGALGGSLAIAGRDLHGHIGGTVSESWQLTLAGGCLAVFATVPLVAWRRAPLGVFALTASASVLLAALGYPFELPLGPIVALYLVAMSRGESRPWTGRTTATAAGFLIAYLAASAAANLPDVGSQVLRTSLAWAVAWFAGERTRLRREQLAELRERAARAEHDAERERLLAVAEERARIARDLHDSAGHAINVIAVHAGVARLRLHRAPDRSLAALKAIEDVAQQTAAEIDQFVGALRDRGPGNGGVPAPPGLASLDSLIAHHAGAGLSVTVDTSGARRPLGSAADHAAYRILQEALTNAARHGVGTAQIELAFSEAALELTVTNPVPATGPPDSGRGHGLIGMRERASMLGGDLDARRADGVFRVRARIPDEGRQT